MASKATTKRKVPKAIELLEEPHSAAEEAVGLLPHYDPYRGAEDYELDASRACYAMAWIEANIKHCKGRLAGKPFILLPWERAVICNLFGWVHRQTKFLRYREALIYVGKKNGKSAFAGAIILYLLAGWPEREFGSEIYGAASTIKQAGHVFNHALGMLKQNQELGHRVKAFGGHGGNQQKSLWYEDQFSAYYPIAADANSADGANVSAAIIDELHRFHTSTHFTFCNVIEMSTAAREQSLVIYTTTADYLRESVCNSKREYAIKVRDGIVEDPKFLPVIYELMPDDDWEDSSIWHRANPSLGQTVELEFLVREYEKAKAISSNRNSFMRMHLNMQTQSDVAWIDMHTWDAMREQFTEDDLIGQDCFAGVDLASTRDLTALVLLFPQRDGFKVLSYFWAARDQAETREREDKVFYTTWASEGFMELTPGEYTDYNVVEHRIKELAKKFNIREIAFDPHGGQQLMNNLDHSGFEVFKFIQSYTNFAPTVLAFDRLMLSRALKHNGNKVLDWCASNVSLDEQVATEQKRPSKRRSSEKIDGIVALLMALGRSMSSEKQSASAYVKRGLFS